MTSRWSSAAETCSAAVLPGPVLPPRRPCNTAAMPQERERSYGPAPLVSADVAPPTAEDPGALSPWGRRRKDEARLVLNPTRPEAGLQARPCLRERGADLRPICRPQWTTGRRDLSRLADDPAAVRIRQGSREDHDPAAAQGHGDALRRARIAALEPLVPGLDSCSHHWRSRFRLGDNPTAAAARGGCAWRRCQNQTRTAVCRKEQGFSQPLGSSIARPNRSTSASVSAGRPTTGVAVSWSRWVREIQICPAASPNPAWPLGLSVADMSATLWFGRARHR